MDSKGHWDDIYRRKAAHSVSWYAAHLTPSLTLIDAAQLPPTAHLLDVGGGASTLPGDLLDRGYRRLTVLDLSAEALQVARSALGARADAVQWVAADITRAGLPKASVDLWHDRAVFHFLTDEDDGAAYLAQVLRALKPGGHLIVATFALDGPERCSGLPVVRYDADALAAAFGPTFERRSDLRVTHRTPGGGEQNFVFCALRRRPEEKRPE